MTKCIMNPNTRRNATNGFGNVSDIPATPFEARQAQLKLADKLLERELERMKHPVRREKPEEWKKEPVEQG